ncbi:ABC transporter permease subunit [Vagococcus lutrae]|uniref:ABC transporter permease subunit n=1 Tax=Vagococcus lutrae TaxID=81947 RepID=UPI00200CE730|nr:ABC transporter permease subunit [Vagococcus lutrae]UQF10921.1 ABC transporter permease subunit [Vagococcus lutrae]
MNKKQYRYLLMALLSLIAFLPLTLSAAENDGVFRVGMEAGYPPFNWTQQTDENGAVPIQGSQEFAGGYDVEIAKRIAEGLNKKLVIVKTEWDGLSPALTSGKIDAIIAGMSPTEERKKSIDFSDVYYQSHLVLLVKKGGPFEEATRLSDFKQAKITAQLNTFHYSVIDQIPEVDKQTAMDNFPAMRVALESGVIDGYVTEMPEALTAANANPNFKVVSFEDGEGFITEPEDTAIAIGVAKNSPLTSEINQVLSQISIDEQQDIMENVIQSQPDNSGTQNWVVKIMKENGSMFLRGAGVTLFISLIGTVVGTLIGLGIGVFRTITLPKSGIKRVLLKALNIFFNVYIEIFRGTPMIVQAMVIYYGTAQAFGIDLNRILAALFIVSINTGAYMTEIVRGGIYAVDKGQFEAAQAIGMTHGQTMRNIVLPQVIRHILPATGNEFVINIKDTSVLNVIAVSELFFQAKTVAGSNFRFFETFFVVCVIYFVMTFTVTQILRRVEKRLDGPEHYAPYANQMQVQEPTQR